jgi:crotonobetainyl-CoA:carnitine CoA-transferase CaiB-like acyl-CoA transferase
MEVFAPLDVCVEPVLDVSEALRQPQIQARRMLVDVAKPNGGKQKQIGSPFRFSGSYPEYKHTGVKLGAHSTEVLAEIGYSKVQIEDFRDKGFLG